MPWCLIGVLASELSMGTVENPAAAPSSTESDTSEIDPELITSVFNTLTSLYSKDSVVIEKLFHKLNYMATNPERHQ